MIIYNLGKVTSIKSFPNLLFLIIFLFLILFIVKSFMIMRDVPFHDFDEAHRAENAKRMKEYKSFFVPLTGSPYDKVENLKIPLRENPNLHLYYHLERPPLVYDLMIISTTVFGGYEWAYRLPSFLFGIGIIAAFFVFARREKEKNIFALTIGAIALITSKDFWLSSQSAQMDTGITFFLFLSLITLITFCEQRKDLLIYLAGLFFGLALLSKLQPAVIFIFPIVFLFLTKKLNIKDLFKFLTGAVLVFLPWVLYLITQFGFKDVIYIMPGFALTSASIIDINHKAPFFWYIRWFWESFRPGWSLFLVFLILDLINLNFTWKKLTILSYIIFGLLAFSLPQNKLWWYVTLLVPAICYYLFLSVTNFLKTYPNKLINLSIVTILVSLPIFLQVTNTIGLLYGILITIISYLILISKIKSSLFEIIPSKYLFYIATITSLFSFYLYFPKIIPYHGNTKPVANYFKNLPGQKCLWIGDMPTEAALFYSNAGEVLPIQVKDHTPVFSGCDNNYLITPDEYMDGKLVIREGNIRLYKLAK